MDADVAISSKYRIMITMKHVGGLFSLLSALEGTRQLNYHVHPRNNEYLIQTFVLQRHLSHSEGSGCSDCRH